MNPSSNEMNLPTPMPEQAAGVAAGTEQPAAAPEQFAQPAEQAMQPPQVPPPTLPVQPAADPVAVQSQAQSDDQHTTQSVVNTANDSDLIEKEWVTKAKQIVERTRDDPHKQSEELTVFKAEYMKKRYGKSIKVVE